MRNELKRQQEEIAMERARLKLEQEKLQEDRKKAELERQRRRLYPEYYAQEDAKRNPPPPPSVQPAKPSVKQPEAVKQPQRKIETKVLDDIKPIDYFNGKDDDEDLKDLVRSARKSSTPAKPKSAPATTKPKLSPSKPVPAKQQSPSQSAKRTETITVGPSDGKTMPWLVELPE